jgi:hypothetical protein
MTIQHDETLEMKVMPPASEALPSDLNLLALELFREMVTADTSLALPWKTETLDALSLGIPDAIPGLEALAFGGQET